jgi:hypothetical protein
VVRAINNDLVGVDYAPKVKVVLRSREGSILWTRDVRREGSDFRLDTAFDCSSGCLREVALPPTSTDQTLHRASGRTTPPVGVLATLLGVIAGGALLRRTRRKSASA